MLKRASRPIGFPQHFHWLPLSFTLTILLLLGIYGIARAQGTTPVPVPIYGHVTLQRPNSPPPSLPWVVPVTVTFYAPGEATPADSPQLAETDQSGNFVITPTLTVSGTYDVRIKNFHTLQNIKRNVQVYPGMSLDLGTLLEGDADNDNRVRISDFAILRNAYFTNEGDSEFDPRADFDENNKIRIRDFALLRNNYFATGDIEVATLHPEGYSPSRPDTGVNFSVVPAWQQVDVGDTFTISIIVDASDQPIVGADVRLTFDGSKLQGIQSVPGSTFDIVLANTLQSGTLTFSAATLGNPVSGRITLVTVTCKTLQLAPRATLHLMEVDAADEEGRSVAGDSQDGLVQVGHSILYFPIALR
ncbi:MAG: hypothetical protein J7M34_00020 [Anaerolineae bacterium]|nr:hypothetical protein [Anaerolineae bacterium]